VFFNSWVYQFSPSKLLKSRYLSWKHNVKSIARRVLYTAHPSASQNTMALKNKRQREKEGKEGEGRRRKKDREV